MGNAHWDHVQRQLLNVIDEAIHGPPEGFAYFSDRGDRAGLLRLLESLDASSASQTVGQTSVAAHVNHLVFSLAASTDFIEGNERRVNWSESWAVEVVTADAWSKLIADLTSGIDRLKSAIETTFAQSERTMGVALGAVAHLAYHIGAIRQKVSLADCSGN